MSNRERLLSQREAVDEAKAAGKEGVAVAKKSVVRKIAAKRARVAEK